ncbi:hypothetical protein PsorP6_014870 [Peronosclerospora sorghi]|uniref:Uncharacterized protein n=1 Tax=Peronosclerospora sorghi TaxID=230839 RepID=A0ACC0VSC8_9STRA|nr:hypothetical protein PsorP6_014870 [Peronosclerospora sorghi]
MVETSTRSRRGSSSVALMDTSRSYESEHPSASFDCEDDDMSWMKHASRSSSVRRRFPTVASMKEWTRSNDQRLHELAAAGASSVHWSKLETELAAAWLCGGKHGNGWKRKKQPRSHGNHPHALKLYTRVTSHDQRHGTRWGPKGFAVLAEGSFPCTVQELRLVFRVTSTTKFCELMRCMHGREFVKGDIVRTIPLQREAEPAAKALESREFSVKTVTFEKRARFVFSKHESWCFLDLLHPRDRGKEDQCVRRTASSTASALGTSCAPAFIRTLVSIARSSVTLHAPTESQTASSLVPNVVINYMFEGDRSGRSTRVIFHGEYVQSTEHEGLKRTGQERRLAHLWILRLATTCHRLVSIVRRRRLGMQVIIHSTQFSLEPKANAPPCACCDRSFSMFPLKRTRKQLCCLCGFFVCDRCAQVQEREHQARGDSFPQIQHVRTCKRCLVRVNQARYTAVTEEDLRPARVIGDGEESADYAHSTPGGSLSSTRHCHLFKTRSASLNDLLLDTLAEATSGKPAQKRHKAFVLNVLKDLVDEERARRRANAVKISVDAELPLLGDHKQESQDQLELDEMQQLEGMWDEGPGWRDEYPLANSDSRNYQIVFPDDEMQAIIPPIPSNEHKRLQLIHEMQLNQLGDVPELGIICFLASKELKCGLSVITIVDETQVHVLASTHPAIPSGESIPREQGFCAQTILDNKPLVSRHVQADVRFSAIEGARKLNINFYCGFPVMGSDGKTVIGSLCCADRQARNLTQSQYAAMSSLASTASRIVQRAANERIERENSIDVLAKATLYKK